MNNLFIINESFTNGYKSEVLDIICILVILSGIFVIISKNPIISLLFLIGLFAGISCYLLIIGLSFLGLSYLVVYIGAVSILFLFILMLINVRMSELQSNTNNSIPLAISIAILFNYPIFQLLPYDIAILSNNNYLNNILYNVSFNRINITSENNLNINNNDILFVTSKIWDGNLAEVGHIASIGNIMYTNYNMWLIITSFILLLAMVGAIVITIKQKN
ncbi:NADH dehydrogenase subunit 6 (mitochondrion) [Sporothrix brasiliensis 5110]|uniref:NADH-ubiquinone oxidoreductase chain 6 n=2 Tax=Sporothrix TaxID=29907 RepID=A0A0C2IGX2_9PEZI|nr:NADH dehydrogenase subunit 6 [Sporothrix brasiliensis 5110]KIH86255.1 NADH dehydrogenase subunit 6 [Sporothrix brasiliensis 5110]KJR79875.1 NADH dehydrogenase subunit 6 [Sporothrix schenckii 1099-18]